MKPTFFYISLAASQGRYATCSSWRGRLAYWLCWLAWKLNRPDGWVEYRIDTA